ncbi:unnamed protein product, partial [Caretta caretta]
MVTKWLAKILNMMEDNKQLALRIDGAIQSASQEMTNLRAELTATSRRLAELGSSPAAPSLMENNQHNAQGPLTATSHIAHPHSSRSLGQNNFMDHSKRKCFHDELMVGVLDRANKQVQYQRQRDLQLGERH